MVTIIAPIVPFTAEEIWQHMPKEKDLSRSVHLTEMVKPEPQWQDDAVIESGDKLLKLRELATKAIELRREKKLLGNSLEAKLKIETKNKDLFSFLTTYKQILAKFFIVSQVDLELTDELSPTAISSITNGELGVEVIAAEGKKCCRCWFYDISVGKDRNFKDVCEKCVEVLRKIKDNKG
jgi:isoleucyl-tRNA synthetase